MDTLIGQLVLHDSGDYLGFVESRMYNLESVHQRQIYHVIWFWCRRKGSYYDYTNNGKARVDDWRLNFLNYRDLYKDLDWLYDDTCPKKAPPT